MRKLLTAVAAIMLLGAPMASADDVPEFDHSDCPKELPAGADPAQWRCEVLVSDATAEFGTLGQLRLGRQRLTFAEGTLDGRYAQVFGGLRAEPTEVPGGLVGNDLIPLAFQVQYAGASDFHGDPPRMGFIDLKLKVISPLLPPTCFIGSDNDPINVQPLALGPTAPVPGHPGIRTMTLQDKRLVMPRAHGCGVFTALVQARFGVPSPAGASEITLPTYVSIRQYDAGHS
ncbi:MAG: hypothetical protein ABW215_12990 [Kibdelosporangium sp.]